MKAVPVETINKIISNIKSDLAIELLKALVDSHAIEISNVDSSRFEKLVARIRAIDSEAADWIIHNEYRMDKEAFTVVELFTWVDSPQGESYWNRISEKLGEIQ